MDDYLNITIGLKSKFIQSMDKERDLYFFEFLKDNMAELQMDYDYNLNENDIQYHSVIIKADRYTKELVNQMMLFDFVEAFYLKSADEPPK